MLSPIDDEHFYLTLEATPGEYDIAVDARHVVMVDINQLLTQHKKASGRSHDFSLALSTLHNWARRAALGKGISLDDVVRQLRVLHSMGINTGIAFGERAGTSVAVTQSPRGKA